MPKAVSEDFLKDIHNDYIRTNKNKIFEDLGELGDIAELGLVCEEIGEGMTVIRKKQGLAELGLECADIIIRTLNFMMRKKIQVDLALRACHQKNRRRNRKGLFIKEEDED